MTTNNWPVIIKDNVLFPDRWLSQREMSRIFWMLQGATSKVIYCFRETNSLIQELRRPLLMTITPKDDRSLFCIMQRQISLRVWDQGGANQANLMLSLCLPGPVLLTSSLISFKRSRQIPQTNPRSSSTPPHVGTQEPNWNHPRWYHLIFAGEARVSP